MKKIVCSWCQTVNHADDAACVACGAPIEKPVKTEEVSNPDAGQVLQTASKGVVPQDLRQAGETADKIYAGAMNAYGLVWRTLGETAAIAVAAFLLGLAGGATQLAWMGVLAGLIVGLAVGLSQKNFWFTILGAPAGVLVGAVGGMLPWALGAGPAGMLMTAAVLGVLGALAGRRMAYSTGWWDKFRPVLGGLGGLLFGGLGALAGAGLAWLRDVIANSLRV